MITAVVVVVGAAEEVEVSDEPGDGGVKGVGLRGSHRRFSEDPYRRGAGGGGEGGEGLA